MLLNNNPSSFNNDINYGVKDIVTNTFTFTVTVEDEDEATFAAVTMMTYYYDTTYYKLNIDEVSSAFVNEEV